MNSRRRVNSDVMRLTDVTTSMDDVKGLINRLNNDADRDDILSATMALQALGASAVPPLVDALVNPSERLILRCRIAEALGMIGSTTAVEPLISTLDDSHVRLRWSALRALARLGDVRSLPALRRLAATDNEELLITPKLRFIMRDEAAKAIRQIKSRG